MDDGDETFDWNAAIREENRQKAIARNERLTREENERRAKAEALADQRRREFYRREVMREYASAGVEPPVVGDDGSPMVSLTFLTSMGWTIEEFGGKKTLVKPDKFPEPVRHVGG